MITLYVASYAQADRIYKSIDAAGNVTYSAIPPEDAVQIQSIIVPVTDASDSTTADALIIDQIRAAADELEQDRKQREAEREMARKDLQAEEAAKQAQKPPEPVIYYYPVYPPIYNHPGRPRPPHPHQPPPRSPGKQLPESQSYSEKPG